MLKAYQNIIWVISKKEELLIARELKKKIRSILINKKIAKENKRKLILFLKFIFGVAKFSINKR